MPVLMVQRRAVRRYMSVLCALDRPSCSTRCHLLSTAVTSTLSSAWGWLRTTMYNYMPVAPQTAPLPLERPSVKPADTCLEWWKISSQCQYLFMECPVEDFGPAEWYTSPRAAVGLAAAMPNTFEEAARFLRLNQLISAPHGAAKPQNTIQAKYQLPSSGVGAAWPSLLFLWRP